MKSLRSKRIQLYLQTFLVVSILVIVVFLVNTVESATSNYPIKARYDVTLSIDVREGLSLTVKGILTINYVRGEPTGTLVITRVNPPLNTIIVNNIVNTRLPPIIDYIFKEVQHLQMFSLNTSKSLPVTWINGSRSYKLVRCTVKYAVFEGGGFKSVVYYTIVGDTVVPIEFTYTGEGLRVEGRLTTIISRSTCLGGEIWGGHLEEYLTPLVLIISLVALANYILRPRTKLTYDLYRV